MDSRDYFLRIATTKKNREEYKKSSAKVTIIVFSLVIVIDTPTRGAEDNKQCTLISTFIMRS